MSEKTSTRRTFLKKSLSAGSAAVLMPMALTGQRFTPLEKTPPATPTLRDKKVLFIYGGWEGHEPEKARDIFVPWMRSEGARVIVSDTLETYEDKELMMSLDLVVQIWTMGTIKREQEQGLLNAVKSGVGLAGWHGGLCDSFRNNVEYQFMTGGQWVSHPGGVIDYKVNIIDHVDPITRGLKDFAMHSEQYYMQVDPNVNVLATTRFTGEHAHWIENTIIPVVWKKYYGNGRVFYSSLGHVMDDFDVEEAMKIQQRGIRWAAESKYHPFEEWRNPAYKT